MDSGTIGNQKPSGAAKREKRWEKEEKTVAAIKNVPRISIFFKKARNEEKEDVALTKVISDTLPCSSSDVQAQLMAASGDAEEERPDADQQTEQDNGTSSSSFTAADTIISEDPAQWGSITESVREEIILKGVSAFQNRAAKYPASSRRGNEASGKSRSLTNKVLTQHLHNGETISREWIIYSPPTGEIYCFACKVLSTHYTTFVTGFSDWKNPERITEHEMSGEHRKCMVLLIHRTKRLGIVDASLERQIDAESQYWKDVLRPVIDVIKFLSERGLPGVMPIIKLEGNSRIMRNFYYSSCLLFLHAALFIAYAYDSH